MTVVRRDPSSNVVLWVVLVIIVVVALWWLFFRGAAPSGAVAPTPGASVEDKVDLQSAEPELTLEPAPSPT